MQVKTFPNLPHTRMSFIIHNFILPSAFKINYSLLNTSCNVDSCSTKLLLKFLTIETCD